MKKIGILYGNESDFPQLLFNKIIQLNHKEIKAEFVIIDKVLSEESAGYDIILDRISNRVPFYREYLKLSAIKGSTIINNPFALEALNKFTSLALAKKEGLPVPKMVLLPTNEHPFNTDTDTFVNLLFPLDWDNIFGFTGFPSFFKSSAYNGLKNVCKVNHKDDFYYVYNDSGNNLMMLQEAIDYDEYYRIYTVGNKDIRIMKYSENEIVPFTYVRPTLAKKLLLNAIKSLTVKVNSITGLEINSVEVAVKDGKLYLIDVFNPVPRADIEYLGEDNFNWLLDKTANYLVKKAEKHSAGKSKISLGDMIKQKPAKRVRSQKPKADKITKKK